MTITPSTAGKPDARAGMPTEREIEEIEAILTKRLRLVVARRGGLNHAAGIDGVRQAAMEIAALWAQDREDGVRPDIPEALRCEAQEQHFRRDLAERTCASLKERPCRAAHLAFAGNDRALRRLVDTIENPKPIHGSGVADAGRAALAEQEKGRG